MATYINTTGTFKTGADKVLQKFSRDLPYRTPNLNWKKTDYYNYPDLDRVEHNAVYVNNILSNYITPATLDSPFESRTIKRFEFAPSLNRIESNILAIRDAFGNDPANWVTPKTNWQPKDAFSNVDANRLERNLNNLLNAIEGTGEYYLITGTFSAGNDRIRQHFAR